MKKKISYFLFILLLILGVFFIYRSCTKIPIKELETLHNELKASDRNIKSIQFRFLRPAFYTDIVYSGEIDNQYLGNIITHFKKAIDYNLITKIADTYWNGFFPHNFKILIYQDVRFVDLPPFYTIEMSITNDSLLGTEKEKEKAWYFQKNYVDPVLYAKGLKKYHSGICRFYLIVGGTILIPLFCILFFKYRKWKRY